MAETWRDALPEDLKGDPALADIKDVVGLAKAYRDTKAYVGTSIRMPGPEAGEADRKEFLDKLQKSSNGRLVDLPSEDDKVIPALRAVGRLPKSVEDYSLEGVEFQSGTELSDEEKKDFRSWALDRGLTKAAAKAELERLAKGRAEGVKAVKANEDALRKEYGPAFDDKLKQFRILAEKINAPAHLKEAIDKRTLSKDDAQWLDRLGQSLGHESRDLSTITPSATPALTPAELRARITEATKKSQDLGLTPQERMDAHQAVIRYYEQAEKAGVEL